MKIEICFWFKITGQYFAYSSTLFWEDIQVPLVRFKVPLTQYFEQFEKDSIKMYMVIKIAVNIVYIVRYFNLKMFVEHKLIKLQTSIVGMVWV